MSTVVYMIFEFNSLVNKALCAKILSKNKKIEDRNILY